MTIRWITPLLGTAPAEDVRQISGLTVVDVRDLVDKAGNRPNAVKEKILLGMQSLKEGNKTVVCCDYGISRSNAVAAGILALYKNLELDAAVRIVQRATGETEIKLAPLNAVRQALEVKRYEHKASEKRTVLVTGASGFIGSAVSKKLAEEFNVIAPSRDEVDIEQGSTQLSLLVGEHNVDCIIHLANPRVYTSNVAMGKTLTMLRNVLDVCVLHGIQLIYPSGWEIYSGYSGHLQVDESVPAFPLGPYGETKYLAESMIEHWRRTTNIRCALLRSSPVYGAGSNRPKFIYNFIEKIKLSEPVVTHQYLNGDPALDLLYLDDFVSALVLTYRQKFVGTLNIGTGVTTSTPEIATMLSRNFGVSTVIKHTHIEATTACIAIDNQQARDILGWQPTVPLQDGLQLLIKQLPEKRSAK